MELTEDQAKVGQLLQETLCLLCKSSLRYKAEFVIEGLIGIQVDKKQVFLVNVKDSYRDPSAIPEPEPEPETQESVDDNEAAENETETTADGSAAGDDKDDKDSVEGEQEAGSESEVAGQEQGSDNGEQEEGQEQSAEGESEDTSNTDNIQDSSKVKVGDKRKHNDDNDNDAGDDGGDFATPSLQDLDSEEVFGGGASPPEHTEDNESLEPPESKRLALDSTHSDDATTDSKHNIGTPEDSSDSSHQSYITGVKADVSGVKAAVKVENPDSDDDIIIVKEEIDAVLRRQAKAAATLSASPRRRMSQGMTPGAGPRRYSQGGPSGVQHSARGGPIPVSMIRTPQGQQHPAGSRSPRQLTQGTPQQPQTVLMDQGQGQGHMTSAEGHQPQLDQYASQMYYGYQCQYPKCGRNFNSQPELDKHHTLHQQGFYRFVCPHCGKGFSRQANMEGHVAKNHEKDRNLTCEACGKSYSYKASLTTHIKTKAECMEYYVALKNSRGTGAGAGAETQND